MRLQIVKSKNAQSLYVVKTIYNNKKRTNKVVEKLGTYENLKKKLYPNEPIEWAKKYVEELNKQEQEGTRNIIVKYNPTKIIEKDVQKLFNGGYLFLEKIYYELGIDKICKQISENYKFEYDDSKELKDQNILRETKVLLSIMYRSYFCSEEEKKRLELEDEKN